MVGIKRPRPRAELYGYKRSARPRMMTDRTSWISSNKKVRSTPPTGGMTLRSELNTD
jgi:hypothetical protein